MFSVDGSNIYEKMNKFYENAENIDNDSDNDNPEDLLNEWLGELDCLTAGLDQLSNTTTNNSSITENVPGMTITNTSSGVAVSQLPLATEMAAPRIDSYRFSMANLEDSHDVDLDAILGELCALENVCERELFAGQKRNLGSQTIYDIKTHNRSLSEDSKVKLNSDDTIMIKMETNRTESPDNDSAFSDNISMLSSESSTSSGGSSAKPTGLRFDNIQQDEASRLKAEKIKMAMEKIKEANIQKLFLKVFTTDGSAKSLLVDEKMTCSFVTRLLADKNHVQMDPKWAIVEHLPDLYMERIYEDHELLVDNLLLWTRDSRNRIYFVEREDKIKLFLQPEKFLLTSTDTRRQNMEFDEHSRNMLLEEFYMSSSIPEVEGPLYLKAESKKGWKKYHFILRASGLYYYPKDKIKSAKDLICLATFENNQIYYGVGWKKKFKAPTDFCFAIKHPRLQEPKSTKYIKYLCADDYSTLEKWMIAMRIAKYGKKLMENYRSLIDELAQEDLDLLANARSCSVSSIAVQGLPSTASTPTQSYPASEAGYGTQSETYSTPSDLSSGRHSRASSSSSSGCMSDSALSSENAFDSEFPMGTIKRKPSMKPSLPLTNITRQLKEVGETSEDINSRPSMQMNPILYTNTGTLTRSHSRRKSNSSTLSGDDGSSNGTMKRQLSYKSRGSMESMGSRSSGNSTPVCGTPIRERALPFSERGFIIGGGEKSITNTSVLNNNTTVSKNFDDMPSSMTDSITSLPPPPDPAGDHIITVAANYQLPPPPPELYDSNLSLDSLPPPPAPGEIPANMPGADLTGSQLSLMSLPPLPIIKDEVDAASIQRTKGNVTPTNNPSSRSPSSEGDRTPCPSSFNTTPICSPPLSLDGSACNTPTRRTSFSPVGGTGIGDSPSSSSIYRPSFGQNHDRSSSSNLNSPSYVDMSPTLKQNNSILLGDVGSGRKSSLRQYHQPHKIYSNPNIAAASSHSFAPSSTESNNYPSFIIKHQQQTEPTSPTVQDPHSHNVRLVNTQDRPSTAATVKPPTKKISFNLNPIEVPPLPKRPLPPKRAESTKLSSPKKLPEPPTDFLKDLQRVMRKKWQVAEKCKLEPETTPHEVLGFRDPPAPLPDYKEHNVSNWVQEHYGVNNLYENVYREDQPPVSPANSVRTQGAVGSVGARSKRPPPPPPPKRSETTQLSRH